MRSSFVLAALLVATPAMAAAGPAEAPARRSPDGKLAVHMLVGPHAAQGRRGDGAPGCAVQRLAIAPGAGVPEHVHATSDETVVMLRGGGTFTIDGVSRPVKAGETVFVPMGRKHAFTADLAGPVEVIQVYDPAGPEARFMAWPEAGASAAPSSAPAKRP